jgi:hypothetical protein
MFIHSNHAVEETHIDGAVGQSGHVVQLGIYDARPE